MYFFTYKGAYSKYLLPVTKKGKAVFIHIYFNWIKALPLKLAKEEK